jgi:hypothetical protein
MQFALEVCERGGTSSKTRNMEKLFNSSHQREGHHAGVLQPRCLISQLRARNNDFALAWVARPAHADVTVCRSLRFRVDSARSRVQRANAVITLAAGQQEISPGERCVCFATASGVTRGGIELLTRHAYSVRPDSSSDTGCQIKCRFLQLRSQTAVVAGGKDVGSCCPYPTPTVLSALAWPERA